MVKGHLLLDVYTSRQETRLTNSWQSYQWRIFYRSYRWIAVFSQKACVLIPPNTVPLICHKFLCLEARMGFVLGAQQVDTNSARVHELGMLVSIGDPPRSYLNLSLVFGSNTGKKAHTLKITFS